MTDSTIGSGSPYFGASTRSFRAAAKNNATSAIAKRRKKTLGDRFEVKAKEIQPHRNPPRTERIATPKIGPFAKRLEHLNTGSPVVKQEVTEVSAPQASQKGTEPRRNPSRAKRVATPETGPFAKRLEHLNTGLPVVKQEVTEVASPQASQNKGIKRRYNPSRTERLATPEMGPFAKTLEHLNLKAARKRNRNFSKSSAPLNKINPGHSPQVSFSLPAKNVTRGQHLVVQTDPRPTSSGSNISNHSHKSQAGLVSTAIRDALHSVNHWTRNTEAAASAAFSDALQEAHVPVERFLQTALAPETENSGVVHSYGTRKQKRVAQAPKNIDAVPVENTKIVHQKAVPEKEYPEESSKLTKGYSGLEFLDVASDNDRFFKGQHFAEVLELAKAGKLSFAQLDRLKTAVREKKLAHEAKEQKAKEELRLIQRKRQKLEAVPADLKQSTVLKRRLEKLISLDRLTAYETQYGKWEIELKDIRKKRDQIRVQSMYGAQDSKAKTKRLTAPYKTMEEFKLENKPPSPYSLESQPLSQPEFDAIISASSNANPDEGRKLQELMHEDRWGNTLLNPRPFHQMSMTQEGLRLDDHESSVSKTYTPSLRNTANKKSRGRTLLASYEMQKDPKSKKKAQLERAKAEKNRQELKTYLEGKPNQHYSAMLYGVEVTHNENGQVLEFPGNDVMNRSLQMINQDLQASNQKPYSIDDLSKDLFEKLDKK